MRLHYHPRKANVVADALSHKSHVNKLMTGELPKELAEDLRELCLEIVPRGYVAALEIQSMLMDKIREAQKTDKRLLLLRRKLAKEKLRNFVRMSTIPYGLRTTFMCLMIRRSGS